MHINFWSKNKIQFFMHVPFFNRQAVLEAPTILAANMELVNVKEISFKPAPSSI